MAPLLELDAALRAWLTGFPGPVWLDHLMLFASVIGRGAAVWFLLAFLIGLRRQARAAAFRAALAVFLVQLTVDLVLKPAFGRVRPFVTGAGIRVIDVRSDTYAFPSGHAANAFAGAYALGRAWPQGRLFLWVLAVLVSVSRIYVGVHYPLDVLGGAIFGLAAAHFITGGAKTPGPR